MDKTLKLKKYSGDDTIDTSQGILGEAKKKDIELAVKEAQLEEERSKSLENLKTIVQLRENLKQEQSRTAEMAKKLSDLETKVKDLVVLEANERGKKDAQLEEEKNRSVEQIKTIEQLRESLKQEQAKVVSVAGRLAELEAKVKGSAVQEAKVKELTEALGKIAAIAATGKAI
jgi:chromosome segregation ATPase